MCASPKQITRQWNRKGKPQRVCHGEMPLATGKNGALRFFIKRRCNKLRTVGKLSGCRLWDEAKRHASRRGSVRPTRRAALEVERFRGRDAPRAAQQRPQRELEQPPGPGVVQHVKAQLATIQTPARAETPSLDLVFVVADEQDRRPSAEAPPVGADADAKRRVLFRRAKQCRGHSHPFGPTPLAPYLSAPDHSRIETDARIMENTRPFTSPTSTLATRPAAMFSTAAPSSSGIPRSLAK